MAAQPALWAGIGLAWGGLEALAADAAGGEHPLDVAAVHATALAVAGLLLCWLPLLGDRRAGLLRLAGLLLAGAVALPAAVFASQAWVRGAPLRSLPNLGVVLGAGVAGLIVARLLRPLLRSAVGRLVRASSPVGNALRVGLPLVLLALCAGRTLELLTPPTPGPWPDPGAASPPAPGDGDHSGHGHVAAGSAPAGAPSVMLITLDTLRADHLSSYGYARPTSPRLDALPGVRFERAYAQAHWTAPSTASLLTGLYPSTHGTNDYSSALPREARTLTERLSDQGWVTGYVTGNLAVGEHLGFARGADWVVSERSLPQYRLFPSTLGRLAMKLLDDLSRADDLNAWALPFLASVGDRPFFLYLHYKDPHHPYAPPGDEFTRFDPEFTAGSDGRTILDPSIRSQWPISPRELENMRARYDGEIHFLDAQLGVIFDELARLGRADDTIVVVTSDHGEEFLDHGGWIHGDTIYEEMIHVPLFVSDPRLRSSAPDAAPRQQGLSMPVRLVDVVPTLLDLLHLPPDGRLPGRSLLPLMLSRGLTLEQIPAQEPPFHETPRPVLSEGTKSGLVTLIVGPWKLIRLTTGGQVTQQLFHLAADPDEQHDLAAEHPERVAELSAQLDAELAPLRAARIKPESREMSPADLEALRQLGYVK